MLNGARLQPEIIYTSELSRTVQTAEILVENLRSRPSSIIADWRLDERNYGALTGLSKVSVRREYGEANFRLWRRSVSNAPPPMGDVLFTALQGFAPFDRLPPEALTRTESLADVIARVGPFVHDSVVADLVLGRNVLIVAHGNSLRALCATLDNLDDVSLEQLNLPTGQPLIYQFGDDLRPVSPGGIYLDPERARAASAEIAREGGT